MKNTFTNSEPIVYHAPGRTRRLPLWGELVRSEFTSDIVDVPSFDVITWSTTETETAVEKSIKSLDGDVTVLRKPMDNWLNIDKVFLTLEFARQSSADYIVGLDAFDVILTKHPSHIVDRFVNCFNCDLLFNASTRSWTCDVPSLRHAEFFENGFDKKYKHLNAGCWVGKREYVIEFFENVASLDRESLFDNKYRKSEQASVKFSAFPSSYPKVDIDSNCIIFQHLRGFNDLKKGV